MRKHYLDNIRWATVVLVVIYHVFYIFNACGVLGGIGSFAPVQYQDGFLIFVYPWFMVLLFVVAGISARYALEKNTIKAFLKGRTTKLLVPSTLGLLVFQWIVGYLNVRIGGGLDTLPPILPIRYIIYALSGTGALWFAQTLWLNSLILGLIRTLDKKDRLYTLCSKLPGWGLPLLFLPLWGSAQILNAPVITVYRFGIYLAAFLIGYLVLSQEKSQAYLEKNRLFFLVLALILGAAYVVSYFGTNYTEDACLKSLFTNLYAWIGVLAVLGCGKAWFDKATPFTSYMSRSSFGLYVLHYLFVQLACWLLRDYTPLHPVLIYPLAIVISLACAMGCNELFRRIPFIRWAVLGIKKKK